uniref:Proline rich 27 n=1 Tax=Nannospalax galili TaxID=1026970 RepID=A0A8C6W977_NANGA
MKLLLWACVICVAFARKRHYPFIYKDYYGNRYPFNPSLNIPFGFWNENLPPFPLPTFDGHQGNAITKLFGNSEPERGLSPYPWISTSSKVHYPYQGANYPSDASANAPAASPPPPPPRPYPFNIPAKIYFAPPVAVEPPGAPAPPIAPVVPEAVVPEFSVDKSPSGLPGPVRLGPAQPAEPKSPVPEPSSPQFGVAESVPAQFGTAEPGQAQLAQAHPGTPEPAQNQTVAAPESAAGHSAEAKPASAEPAAAQSIPAESATGQSLEAKPAPAEPFAVRPNAGEAASSQSAVGKLITAEPTEVKSEPGGEPPEMLKPSGQEPPLPLLFDQVGGLPYYCKAWNL